MRDRDFVEFLAALWESRGWETAIRERSTGVYVITGDRESDKRGLMLVVPDPGTTVNAQLLGKVAGVIESKGVDVGVAATRGTFGTDAERVANANDIHLLDPPALEQTIAAEDAYDLLEEFRTGSDRSLIERLPSVPIAVPRLPTGGIGIFVAVIATMAIAYTGLGFLGLDGMLDSYLSVLPLPDLPIPSLPIPDLGLGGGGFPVTAVSLSQANTTPVDVQWDARRQQSLVAPNGVTFESEENETFVVVQLNVSNPDDETLVVRSEYLALSAGNTRYGAQFLKGGSEQLPMTVQPNSSKRGYVVFAIPEDADSATLIGLPGDDVPPMQFERDSDMAFQTKVE